MKPVEIQLWELALDEERDRVTALHEEMKAKGKMSKAQFVPGRVKRPWSWKDNWKCSLYDIPRRFVLQITEFDFDLYDQSFQDYVATYDLQHRCRKRGSAYWHALNDHTMNFESFSTTPEFRDAQEHEGTRHSFTEEELRTQWEIFQFTRVMLQAAWDVYSERDLKLPV